MADLDKNIIAPSPSRGVSREGSGAAACLFHSQGAGVNTRGLFSHTDHNFAPKLKQKPDREQWWSFRVQAEEEVSSRSVVSPKQHSD